MLKTILVCIDNVDDINTEEKLLSKLDEIEAIESCSYNSDAKLLKVSYNSLSLSHANYIYEYIESLGFIVR